METSHSVQPYTNKDPPRPSEAPLCLAMMDYKRGSKGRVGDFRLCELCSDTNFWALLGILHISYIYFDSSYAELLVFRLSKCLQNIFTTEASSEL